MKHGPKHPRRFAPHIQAVIDLLRRIGAEIIDAKPQRKVMIIWRFAGRVERILVAATPKNPATYADEICERVLAMCGGRPMRAGA